MAILVALCGAACGSSQKVGNEGLLNFQEQQNAQRLGGATAPPTQPPASAGALTVGGAPTAAPTPKPAPAVKKQYFDVTLVANSPFYQPGNAVTIRTGVYLRVTNKDMTPERKSGRTFTDRAGSFNSGTLKPGQVWIWQFTQPGSYEVIDQGLTFATARLEVSP